MLKKFRASAIGSRADIKAGVDISKVNGGYFSSPKNNKSLLKIGVAAIEKKLPKIVKYADFGGGQGLLARPVVDFLKTKAHTVRGVVVDGNENYLAEAKKKGLAVALCNLESCPISNLDLLTMRAVIHYNTPPKQRKILRNVFSSLKVGGYFVHQVSSGSVANCTLRAAIVNLPELGRGGAGKYHWTSVDEALQLHEDAGFSDTYIAGYAPSASWGPEEQWERFNKKLIDDATREQNQKKLQKILHRREKYFTAANAVIKKFLKKYGAKETGIEQKSNGNFTIHYPYPIIISRK